MIRRENVEYYLLQNTLVDEDLANEKREVIRENTVTGPDGHKLFTITYNQVLQDFGVRNWNGRVYTEKIVMPALDNNPLIQHDIKMGTWACEYGHPLIEKGQNELARQMTIFPPNACNTIDKYWKEGNLLMGQCTTLSGGFGDLVRDRIITGFPAMASSRAVGGVDKNGNVLPGYTVVTFDTVIRPSHKTAYMVNGSQKIHAFEVPNNDEAPAGNTMSESAFRYNYVDDPSFKDFLLSESVSKQKISMVCDTFKLDYDSMVLAEGALKISSLANGQQTTVIMPLNKLINAEYYHLFG